jgi:hypothetical protein
MCVSRVVSWVLSEGGYAGLFASWVFGRKGGCVEGGEYAIFVCNA